MLYRDYSRKAGEWIPNVLRRPREPRGDRLPARSSTSVVGASAARARSTIAEESTAWPGVTRRSTSGGLGFDYKWNMGWMHDTLRYIAQRPDPPRATTTTSMTFGLLYAFTENFVLPLSHDEVVHGKGSLLGKMPGDRWQKFANLRAYFGFMWAHPGKKLLFMGGEIRPGARVEPRSRARLAPARRSRPCAASSGWCATSTGSIATMPALHRRDCEPRRLPAG